MVTVEPFLCLPSTLFTPIMDMVAAAVRTIPINDDFNDQPNENGPIHTSTKQAVNSGIEIMDFSKEFNV